jgi:purine nucleosidase
MVALPLILDTDIGSDVDDALALAFALRHPEIDLRAVTTVSGDVVVRARIARKLLQLAGRGDIEVAVGVSSATEPGWRSAWGGHEGEGLREPGDEHLDDVDDLDDVGDRARDAVTLLLDERDCDVATIGMQSNIAAALDHDPAYRPRRLAVMGGVFAPIRFLGAELSPAIDHNLNVDQAASVRALNAGLPAFYVPCNVTFEVFLTGTQVDRLRRGDVLCQALARLIDRWTMVLQQVTDNQLPPEVAAILHDPLLVACTVDRRFVTSERMRVTVALHEGDVRTFVDPAAGHEVEVITSVDATAFAEFWLETVLGA